VPANTVVVGWCLQEDLSWCSTMGIGASCRSVPPNLFVELVLSQGDWCLQQVGAYKHCNNKLVPANIVKVGWCLQYFIKELFCCFPPFGFPRKKYVYYDSIDVVNSLHY